MSTDAEIKQYELMVDIARRLVRVETKVSKLMEHAGLETRVSPDRAVRSAGVNHPLPTEH